MANQQEQDHLWWHEGIIYQIYPRSFQDSDGDGVGDLKGIISRLDYLKWLGITAIWVSPIYPSPMADFGYDISDYCAIHPLFGDMDDFDELLRQVHERDMKLILDLVPNHTSNQHPWFQESKSSRDNPKRDWYLWEDPAEDGSEPNNWLSVFGGSGWEWDEHTQQYYYHAFLKEQPDLNWRNPEVQQAMFNVMRFWLNKGVDGFRVDVMWHMVKDKELRDNPPNPDYQEHMSTYEKVVPVYSTDQPEVHEIVAKMREVTNSYDARLIIGEIYLPIHRLVTYYGPNNSGVHLPFNFMLVNADWNAKKLSLKIAEYEAAIPKGGWPNWVIGNHDQPRITSRVGYSQAKVAGMLLLTLRGTPTMYYGDELGMRDVPIPPDEVQDPQGLNMPDKDLSRDPERTPMQWDSSENAGFTDGKPWLRLPDNFRRVNVEAQREDDYSMLTFYRNLIRLRQKEPALHIGDYAPVISGGSLLSYIRKHEGRQFLIILNLSHKPCHFRSEHHTYKGRIVLATDPEREGKSIEKDVSVSGDEGLVVQLD
ncbi:alpha-amylase family glycosyl hydrolase [Pontibacter toksunensis]|uniref:Alpha-amylase family glycosyl hydrolase n=1 Tax=Pontibacter toksunensis TaxID=1332631 RepID=A0ABW6BS62_9BACT